MRANKGIIPQIVNSVHHIDRDWVVAGGPPGRKLGVAGHVHPARVRCPVPSSAQEHYSNTLSKPNEETEGVKK
ncbi:hypothetical protein RR46_00844 [Papilio xuthus]|uniref:Uncharacterized protein n=1 Tax=Papilio xuthus TaxID=66420 RepID=A0A0N0P9B3_PAPXU|nr:hypothetical protein RR46_00844 [Papilio xuthus]